LGRSRGSWNGWRKKGSCSKKAGKNWDQKINDLERLKAIRSALSATLNKQLVNERGHKIPDTYPFILDNSFEDITKTKDLRQSLTTLGFKDELSKSLKRKVSIGKAKIRGRKRKTGKSVLFVVSKECALKKAAKNIPGMEVVVINNINTDALAPGCQPGRATLFTEAAIEKMKKDFLFTKNSKTKKIGKKPGETKLKEVVKSKSKKRTKTRMHKIKKTKVKEE
jgi:large subunit ribosomal protein L4e